MDTETSGFPSPKTLATIVQFSYVVYNVEKGVVDEVVDHIITQPKGFVIPESAKNIHGITDEICVSNGVSLFPLLDTFIDKTFTCTYVVGHNIQFDLNMIITAFVHLQRKAEERHQEDVLVYIRQQLAIINNLIIPKARCTMKLSTSFCAIPRASPVYGRRIGENVYKYPKLSELYEKIFGVIPPNLHNSLEDVYACMACYNYMESMGIL